MNIDNRLLLHDRAQRRDSLAPPAAGGRIRLDESLGSLVQARGRAATIVSGGGAHGLGETVGKALVKPRRDTELGELLLLRHALPRQTRLRVENEKPMRSTWGKWYK